ncbi:MAG: DUF3187 family protein [Candidatus Lambdaproteobacteria bacterium]|nr:DUF3187 family protein [Candidatus Lambdaproteobacteria bacterium]
MLPFQIGPRALPRCRAIVLAALWLALAAGRALWAAPDNGGLGPLSLRNQFPPSLGYLNFTPEAPRTLPAGDLRLTYQLAVANTFINTQAPSKNSTTVIDKAAVLAGLDESDFPAMGYGAYIDLETTRHAFALRYGLFEQLELGLDMAWISLGGGGLDAGIESFESSIGALNKDRTRVPRNRFDFYLIRDGKFLVHTSRAADLLPQDPVLQVKWNWGDGGDLLPMVTLKGTYKAPLLSDPGSPRNLVSSGGIDYGYYLLLAKRIGSVIGHLQFGATQLQIDGGSFNAVLEHKLFGLEFRSDDSNSWVFQVVTQSSLFEAADFVSNQGDFLLSRPTDVLVLGHKYQGRHGSFDVGFAEDFNQNQNETDIILFVELGWTW